MNSKRSGMSFLLTFGNEILAHGKLLEQFGPQLGRPRVDTLKESKYANMKELRFDAADGVWRVAFVSDPRRRAILLVAGDRNPQRASPSLQPWG